MTGWIVLCLFLLFLGWLLWSPIRIAIDSEAGIFGVEWLGLGRLQWLPEKSLDRLYLSVGFFQWPIRFASAKEKSVKPERSTRRERLSNTGSGKKFSAKTMLRMARNILRSFRIKRFHLVWDSDDFIWNARLYPIAWQINRRIAGRLEINFQGRRELALTAENRLARLIWAVLKTFTHKQ